MAAASCDAGLGGALGRVLGMVLGDVLGAVLVGTVETAPRAGTDMATLRRCGTWPSNAHQLAHRAGPLRGVLRERSGEDVIELVGKHRVPSCG